MRTVKPIEPIRAARGIRRITLRRVPSIKQLRMWLAFAQQKAKDGPGRAAVASSEAPAQSESGERNVAADPLHIDKRV